MNPFRGARRRWHGRGAYPRGRLHKRIFVWFGISIAITTAVVLRLSEILASPEGIERAERFMASQFAGSWDDPARRDSLAAAVARDFGLSVSTDRCKRRHAELVWRRVPKRLVAGENREKRRLRRQRAHLRRAFARPPFLDPVSRRDVDALGGFGRHRAEAD